jgi:SAM-dependent methyltransferase
MISVKDDRGFNQGFKETYSTLVRLERRANWIVSYFDVTNGTVMEIGCGTGRLSFLISVKSNLEVLGVDICAPFIEQAKNAYQKENLQYDILDFTNIRKIEHLKFDYIVGNGILHHLYYTIDERLISIKNLLNPNGKLIFFEPNLFNPYCLFIFKLKIARKWAHLEPSEMAFSKKFIEEKLKKAGFQYIRVSYKDFLLPSIPKILIKPSIYIGNILEKTPLIQSLSQSLLIVAKS